MVNGSTTTVTEYLDGFQYENQLLQFFPHSEGYVRVTTVGINPTNPQYVFNYAYNYTDHLGNIRLTYGKDPQSGDLKVMEENHYYPFGLKHKIYGGIKKDYLKEESGNGGGGAIRPGVVIESPYNYKFNGKEWQDELNLNVYDFHARMYDPTTGRTVVPDPLAENFAHQSPYSFFNNNPLRFIDPTGMAGEDWFDDGNGNLKYNPDLTEANASTILTGNQSYVGKTPSVADNSGNYQLNEDGSFTNTGTGKNYSGGETVTLDSGISIASHTSTVRAGFNYVTDNIASPIVEGVQVLGYIFKGGLYDIPKMAIEEGRAENLHVEMDINLLGFEKGKLTTKTYKDDRSMSFEDKKNAFVKPGLSALTSRISITGNTLVDAVLGGEILNYFIDNIKQN